MWIQNLNQTKHRQEDGTHHPVTNQRSLITSWLKRSAAPRKLNSGFLRPQMPLTSKIKNKQAPKMFLDKNAKLAGITGKVIRNKKKKKREN